MMLKSIKMHKKGQGLSINTIIIAIIVLVVLVVLVMVFTGYFSGWTRNVASCTSQGGTCIVTTQCIGPFDNEVNKLQGVCQDADGAAISGELCCPPGSRAAS